MSYDQAAIYFYDEDGHRIDEAGDWEIVRIQTRHSRHEPRLVYHITVRDTGKGDVRAMNLTVSSSDAVWGDCPECEHLILHHKSEVGLDLGFCRLTGGVGCLHTIRTGKCPEGHTWDEISQEASE